MITRTDAWRETLMHLTTDRTTEEHQQRDPREVLRRFETQPALQQAAARVLRHHSFKFDNHPALVALRNALEAATDERWTAPLADGEADTCECCGGIPMHEVAR